MTSATRPVVEGDAALAETGLAELPLRLARPASRRERRSTAVNLIVPGGVSERAFTTSS